MKRKKLWITIISIVASFVALLTGGYFLTKLSSVSVEFRNRLNEGTRLETGILDKVKASGDFNYNSSVLLLNTKKSVEKIEKDHPYIKVQQVLRKFPNKLVVYVTERVPKYRVKDNDLTNKWYILDDEFKVLECVTTEDVNSEFNAITVEIGNFNINAVEGEFLNKPTDLLRLNEIMSGVYGKTKDYFAISKISYSAEDKMFYISTKADKFQYENVCEIQIKGLDNLKEKAFMATSVFVEKDFDGIAIDLTKKIIIYVDNDGCLIQNV